MNPRRILSRLLCFNICWLFAAANFATAKYPISVGSNGKLIILDAAGVYIDANDSAKKLIKYELTTDFEIPEIVESRLVMTPGKLGRKKHVPVFLTADNSGLFSIVFKQPESTGWDFDTIRKTPGGVDEYVPFAEWSFLVFQRDANGVKHYLGREEKPVLLSSPLDGKDYPLYRLKFVDDKARAETFTISTSGAN